MTRTFWLVALAASIVAAVFAATSPAASKSSADLLETLSVPTSGATVTSQTSLDAGVTYQLRASGTAHVGCEGGDDTDAEWSCFPNQTEDYCNNDPNSTDLGIAIDDSNVMRNGRKQPYWGDFDPTHVYTIQYTGQGAPISLNFHDCNFGDNGGSLTVEIFGPPSGGGGSPDSTPPAVSISLDSPNGATPDGLDGWFRFGPVQVTIAADDTSTGGSAITAIDCGSAAPATTGLGIEKATGELSLATDGVYHLSCTATDAAGNTSEPVTQDVKLDTTPPAVERDPTNDTCDGPTSNGWCRASSGNAAYTLSDALSGATGPIPGVCDPGATCRFIEGAVGQGFVPTNFGAACDLAGNCVCDIPNWVTGSLFCRATFSPLAPYVQLDSAPPTIQRKSLLDSCSIPGTNGWCRGTQSAGFTAADAVSGLGSPCTSPPFGSCDFSKTSAAEGSAVMVSSGQACDAASNCADAVQAGPFKVDGTGPTLAPALNPRTIYLHARAVATPNAADPLSGVASQSCAPVDTSSVGMHTLTCTAVDNAGNSSTTTVRYLVEYHLLGFYGLPFGSTVHRGSIVAIRIALADVHNVVVPDAEARAAASSCRVGFASAGAQSKSGCMAYYSTSNELRADWRLGPQLGRASITATVGYDGTSATTSIVVPVVIAP